MSTAHAIAAVTKVLVNLVDDALKAASLAGIVGSDVAVSAIPPRRVDLSGDSDPNQLNLFLYLARPNQAGGGFDLPTRDASGARTRNTPLALDLYYLATAYGAADFNAHMILGHTLQVFHENPILARDAIRAKLKPSAVPTNAEQALAESGIADQVELIKVSTENLTTEDLSRLWSALGAEYRPSVAYRVTVILIEANASTKSGLPVLQRRVYVRPLSTPVIERIATKSAAAASAVENQPILPGYILVLAGKNLQGELTRVVVDGVKLDAPGAFISAARVDVPLPPDLRAGPHGVQIVHELAMGVPPTPHTGTESNILTFLLRPTITAPVTATATAIIVELHPPVTPEQTLRVLLNELAPPANRAARAYSFAGPIGNGIDVGAGETETDTVEFEHRGVLGGEYLVRVQVDGAESVLETNVATGAFSKPSVTFP